MSRSIRVLLVFIVMLGIAAVICASALFVLSGGQPLDFVQKALIRMSLTGRQDELNRPVSGDTSPVRFVIAPGDTPRAVAQNLSAANLILDANLFVDYARLYDYDRQLEAGTYFLNPSLTIPDIVVRLIDSRSSHIPFAFPEGLRIEEVARRIDAADYKPYFGFTGAEFMAAVGAGAAVDPGFSAQVGLRPGASLEGFLFPDTYQLPPEVTPSMLRDILTQAFLEKIGTQIPQDAQAQGFSLYEVVTLASIVQREQSVHPDEQPLVASVYRNRLAIGQPLEADPTVQYGIGFQNETWWPRITAADYQAVISPYNTYRNAGLPPGPIASPGLSAIQAVVYPAESDYLFFRADCRADGYHDFARTFEEHLANGC